MRKRYWLIAALTLALPLIHPYGPVRQLHAAGAVAGVSGNDQRVERVIDRACGNCHSHRTQWPGYSYLPVVSWMVERDVAEARRHMDFSRWSSYSNDQKLDLLARIGAEVRNRRMPPNRYLLLHPEARLSEAEIQAIYDWTKARRRVLRKQRE